MRVRGVVDRVEKKVRDKNGRPQIVGIEENNNDC